MSCKEPPFWIGDREFRPRDLDLIVSTVHRFRSLSCTELAATICENLPWKAPNGQLKIHSCLLLLDQLQAGGLLTLPSKRAWTVGARAERVGEAPPGVEVRGRLAEILPVRVELVRPERQSAWTAMMATEHPLGYRRAFGAHLRYWVWGQVRGTAQILGGLLFAAAAKALAGRDEWIGWTAEVRQRNLYRIVANSRYLLRPGVQVPHLASHVLGLALRRLGEDWRIRYGFTPVLVETFIESPWAGTCYRAANWVHVGETAGRGRQDRHTQRAETVKQIWVYPLVGDCRQQLLAPAPGAYAGGMADGGLDT